ncbi:hypothetical protein EC396_00830 [Lutibacter sp. HS1-25]|uniref:hypothetical protein n=1 Tax=Lutibacter sp. HS1-25 TaxID=2485000 RepID=UPI001012F323|nr:hypothetical protein [Lutibacter sp. HS1-25]RXP64552.1 hypothetical protein EC396_00830 [Lutibacter sp. HS1-25]
MNESEQLKKLRKEVKFSLRNLDELYQLEIENFNEQPDLKRRLKIHVLNKYQGDASFKDKDLLKEFNLLKENNELNLLFVEEGGY